jgi:phosphate transport system substrate-binding protein
MGVVKMRTTAQVRWPKAGTRNLGHSRRAFVWLALALAASLGISIVFAQEGLILVGSGSSVPAPLYAKWAEKFNQRQAGTQLRYLPIGASEGIKQISHGSGDFGAGEVPLTAADRAEGNLVELPSVLIGVVPIYNLPGVHHELRFTGEVLAEIYLGEIKTWNSPALVKLNPDAELPDHAIKVIYRPPGKGTNYVFSEFLSKTSAKFRTRIGISASPKWPVGEAAERSSDMADKVKGITGAIGFVEQQYAVKNSIPYASVENASGKFVKATPESIAAACRAAEAPSWDRFSASLSNAAGEKSFPITSFSWLYLRTASPDAKHAAARTELLNWIYSDGQQIAENEGYSQLPQELLAKIKAKASTLK